MATSLTTAQAPTLHLECIQLIRAIRTLPGSAGSPARFAGACNAPLPYNIT